MTTRAMSRDWVSVYQGPASLAALLSGELQDNGIPAFTPDANMKALDPLDVGGAIFDVQIWVARADAERALDLLRSSDELHQALDADEPPVDPRQRTLERHANRARWCAVIPLFAPYGLWLAFEYFRYARATGLRARRHGLTVLATWLLVADVVAGLTLWNFM